MAESLVRAFKATAAAGITRAVLSSLKLDLDIQPPIPAIEMETGGLGFKTTVT